MVYVHIDCLVMYLFANLICNVAKLVSLAKCTRWQIVSRPLLLCELFLFFICLYSQSIAVKKYITQVMYCEVCTIKLARMYAWVNMIVLLCVRFSFENVFLRCFLCVWHGLCILVFSFRLFFMFASIVIYSLRYVKVTFGNGAKFGVNGVGVVFFIWMCIECNALTCDNARFVLRFCRFYVYAIRFIIQHELSTDVFYFVW